MLVRLRELICQHKRKFMIGGIVIAGGFLAVRYAERRLKQFQQDQAREFIARTKRTQHFEMTERICNKTIAGFATCLCECIIKTLDTDQLLVMIREQPGQKVQLWEQLKIKSFTRVMLLVYSSAMMVVSLRVQLNVLGGYLYKDTMSGVETVSMVDKEQYLMLMDHLMKDGVGELATFIEEKVTTVLANYTLKQMLTLADMEKLFWSLLVAMSDDANDIANITQYLYPADGCGVGGTPMAQQLFLETVDVLQSDEIQVLNAKCVRQGVTILMDHIAGYFSSVAPSVAAAAGSSSKADLNIVNINTMQMAIAKLIPIVNGLTAEAYNVDASPYNLATSILNSISFDPNVKTMGMNVYEAFSQ